jgi:hypothetical protein
MSDKSSSNRKHESVTRRTKTFATTGAATASRASVAGGVAASTIKSFPYTAVLATKHGLRLSTKSYEAVTSGRATRPKGPRRDFGFVEVRLDPKRGSAAAHELLSLTISAAVDCIASIPEKQGFEEVLASVKKLLTQQAGSPQSSALFFTELRRLLENPVDQDVEDEVDVHRSAPAADFEIPAANRAALARAFARAEANNVQILKRPDMLRGEEIGERLNLSRAAIDQRRVAGRLLALELGTKRGVRYPEWQLELVDDAVGRAAFESVLAALAKTGPWSRYRFFVQPAPVLGGRTPIEALKAGEGDAVRRAAETWVAGEQGGH